MASRAGVRSILVIKTGCRARRVLRIRPSPEWTPEGDARLERLVKEKKGRWRRVAREMTPPGRSARQCRDRWRDHLARDLYHRPFTAGDDEELQRLFLRHGGRWKEIRRATHGRTSRVLRRRWKEIRNSDAFLAKLWTRPPAADAAAAVSPASLPLLADDVFASSCSSSSLLLAPGGGLSTCMPVF
ncbi:hypothetical protein PR202_ga13383 [Eleusine coracana subsp. coracana]|uniref:Uncharacterized protein n=1 Tax=Eleusine coracana subsp. coracana TaxID=191504 RepID=A0AAV5CEE5_ELECO|nr:hypothetical protein QOZ80_3BG0262410 [Eleusine coracana subsp. coracana]GJM96540.1 hypothetical protein PR202_ga13383 [Eleusine coracana subsp. coracana]